MKLMNKKNYLVGEDEETVHVIKNASLDYKNQPILFDEFIQKNKSLSTSRTPTERISSEKLFKPNLGLLSSPLSIRFSQQETIAETAKLKP